MVRTGKARRGGVRQGVAPARHGGAVLGSVVRGLVRHGLGRGVVRLAEVSARSGEVWRGWVLSGAAWRGKAGLGSAQ
jgi:hypothetical protein